MTNNIAVDTNVLVYLYDASNPLKRQKAKEILADNPDVPVQVISAFLNTMRRLLPMSKEDLLFHVAKAFESCPVMATLLSTLYLAAKLIKKYRFQLFDAVNVAASLEGGCDILYSEDMQHGLVINGALAIVNPFR